MKNSKTHEDIIESASVTSLMRYLLSGDNTKIPNPDSYGKYFVNGKWKQYLSNKNDSLSHMQSILPGCAYYHLIRTFKFDTSLKEWAFNNKNGQVIILGSGFDSRAFRFKELLNENNISVFELDLAAMLSFKEKEIKSNNLIPCKSYNLVPCNFNDNNLIGLLSENGIDFKKSTLVLWEGVTYFLTKEIIEKTLTDFRSAFTYKLQVTLDYAFRDYVEGDLNFYGAKELYQVLIEIDEPHLFGLNFNESNNFFNSLGYKVKENDTALVLESKYLRDSFGNSVGLPHVFNAMADITSGVAA